jgi:ABC transporter with metal-binding/Fe-S-binding domain ATP-binding protein
MTEDAWVSLFSGGKDSSWALYQALEEGMAVERLLTVHPDGDSYMYHVPGTELASLAAESIGIELVDIHPDSFEAEKTTDVGEQGDAELAVLEDGLRALDDDLPGGIGGVTVGAVESEFQNSRVEAMSERLGIETFAPLWQRDPRQIAADMLTAGFEITIIRVAAGGLDESWLGRTLDADAMADLAELAQSHGVHPLGEGGEFETLVQDGPHMNRRIELDYETEFDGTRGRLQIADAWLA